MQAVFLPGEKKEEYLLGEPATDDRFIGVFAHELEHSGGYTPEEAKNVARTLLPDRDDLPVYIFSGSDDPIG